MEGHLKRIRKFLKTLNPLIMLEIQRPAIDQIGMIFRVGVFQS
jgi:hypothetical protein